MTSKTQKLFFFYAMFLCVIIVLCAPIDADATRVIFHAPHKIHLGQVLATRIQEKPCPQCQMRDHRGHCRKMISFKKGSKC